jgi:hypothetical protein
MARMKGSMSRILLRRCRAPCYRIVPESLKFPSRGVRKSHTAPTATFIVFESPSMRRSRQQILRRLPMDDRHIFHSRRNRRTDVASQSSNRLVVSSKRRKNMLNHFIIKLHETLLVQEKIATQTEIRQSQRPGQERKDQFTKRLAMVFFSEMAIENGPT